MIDYENYLSLKENDEFSPIAFETLGCMGSYTKVFMKSLKEKILKNSTVQEIQNL